MEEMATTHWWCLAGLRMGEPATTPSYSTERSAPGHSPAGRAENTFTLNFKTILAGQPATAVDIAVAAADTGVTLTLAYAPGAPASVQMPFESMEQFDLNLRDPGLQSLDASAYTGDIHAVGGAGGDTLTGGSGEDFIEGLGGADTIAGGPGFDYVQGGAGADTFGLRDGGIDRALCGTEADTVTADEGDAVAGDCESVNSRRMRRRPTPWPSTARRS